MLKRFSVLLIVVVVFNCEALIEVEDISNEAILVLAPADNSTLNTTTVNFSWQSLEFAETYHLQIAIPNFESAQAIVEDTLISLTNHTKTLSEGNYQWRVRATNFGYETQYTTQTITIED